MLNTTNQTNTANAPGQPGLPFTIPFSVRRPDTAHPINGCDNSVNYQQTSVVTACFPRAPNGVRTTASMPASACLSFDEADCHPWNGTGLLAVRTFHAGCCRIAGKNGSSILSTHFPEVSRKNGQLCPASLSASASVRSTASPRNPPLLSSSFNSRNPSKPRLTALSSPAQPCCRAPGSAPESHVDPSPAISQPDTTAQPAPAPA